MRRGIDAARHAAQNNQPAECEVPRKHLRHPRPVRSGMPRSHYRDRRLGQKFDVSPHPKERGRVEDLFQSHRICLIGKGQQRSILGTNALPFLLGIAKRLPSGDILHRRRRKPQRLQIGQRKLKNASHRPNVFNRLQNAPRPEPGSERERKPRQLDVIRRRLRRRNFAIRRIGGNIHR